MFCIFKEGEKMDVDLFFKDCVRTMLNMFVTL